MQSGASETVTSGKVMDAYALVVFLEGEPGAAQVESMLHQALRNDTRLEMTVVNLGEVYYSLTRKKNMDAANELVNVVLGLPITFVPVDWDLARQAAQFKAHGGIAYVDCFAAALAYQHSLPLVTGDPEFHRLEDYISIEWI